MKNLLTEPSTGGLLWEKMFLEISQKFKGKHLCQSLFFNKVAGLRPANLLKKKLWHRCFRVNFEKFWRSSILTPLDDCLFIDSWNWMLINSAKYSAFLKILTNTSIPANISTSDQRCFNVVDQRWNNVGPTLKMKQNPTSDFQRCTTLKQRHCPTLKQRRNSVDTTLFQPSVDVS